MKYVIIIGDGMADRPREDLGGKTPLMAANTPNLDALAARGRCGLFATVPLDMNPCSAAANLAVLGYDPKKYFRGRAVLEAASMGVELAADELALRCNLICIENGKIKNHSAGHISSEEGAELIAALNQELGADDLIFHPGVSYRHLITIRGGSDQLDCTPPHDVPGTPFTDVLPRATTPAGEATATRLNELIAKSQSFLQDHPINVRRRSSGKDPANSIWPWAPGYRPAMETLNERFGINGAVISAVDLVKGLGIYAGMDVIEVAGATGLHDTNYEGKAEAAVAALADHDLVYVHVEASDEAGHDGNAELKLKTIEYLDQRLVKYIVEQTKMMKEPVAIAVTPDHATPAAIRTHVHDPVPFIIYRPGETPDEVTRYDEETAAAGSYGTISGDQFITALLADS